MKTSGLIDLTGDGKFMEWILSKFEQFHQTDNMTSIQAIMALKVFLSGTEAVRKKIANVQNSDRLLEWYSVYLYLWCVRTGKPAIELAS